MDTDFRQQWPSVDKSFLKELVDIHNETVIKKRVEGDFETFILEQQERFNNPDYLQIAIARIKPVAEYYDNQFQYCSFIFDFMNKNPDWEKLNFGFLEKIRMAVFYDTFEVYLKNRNE